MKATIERATLLRGLSHVQSVVERRNTIPILSNVLIEAQASGALRLMATDLDLQIDETIPAAVDQPGAITVPAHTLFDIVRKLPEGAQVALSAADGRIIVNAGRAKFTLATLPRDDFPMIAEGELPTVFELPAETLKQIIDKTRFAISTEETRYYLNGIHFHMIDAWTLRAVATDGHRMFWADIKIPGAEIARDGVFARRGIIVPRDIICRIVTKFAKCDEVAFTVGRQQVANAPARAEGTAPMQQGMPRAAFAAKVGEMAVTYSGKTIDGTFPDYRRVIPASASWHMTVPVGPLRRAAHACVAAGSGRAPGVTLARRGKTLECSVSADWAVRSTDRERVRIAVPITASAGLPDNSEVGVNGNYLLACLANCTGETVTMGSEWTGERDPSFCPIRMSDDGNADFGMVLMPMRV